MSNIKHRVTAVPDDDALKPRRPEVQFVPGVVVPRALRAASVDDTLPPTVPHRPVPVLLVEPPAMPASILRAIARRPEPAVLIFDRPKAAEREKPIDVILPIAPARFVRPGCCTPQLCSTCGPDCGGRRAKPLTNLVATGPVGRGVGHTPMCRLLDAPARKRGWKFTCICGRDR